MGCRTEKLAPNAPPERSFPLTSKGYTQATAGYTTATLDPSDKVEAVHIRHRQGNVKENWKNVTMANTKQQQQKHTLGNTKGSREQRHKKNAGEKQRQPWILVTTNSKLRM